MGWSRGQNSSSPCISARFFGPGNSGFDRIRLHSSSSVPIELVSFRQGSEAQLRARHRAESYGQGPLELARLEDGSVELAFPAPVTSGRSLYEARFRTRVFFERYHLWCRIETLDPTRDRPSGERGRRWVAGCQSVASGGGRCGKLPTVGPRAFATPGFYPQRRRPKRPSRDPLYHLPPHSGNGGLTSASTTCPAARCASFRCAGKIPAATTLWFGMVTTTQGQRCGRELIWCASLSPRM